MNAKNLILPESRFNKLYEKSLQAASTYLKKECTIEDFKADTRREESVLPRHISAYFLKGFTKLSLASIGANLVNRDHASIMNACKKIAIRMETDKRFKNIMDQVEEYVEGISVKEDDDSLKDDINTHVETKQSPYYMSGFERNLKAKAEERLIRINRLEQQLYESTKKIQDLEYNLKATQGELRLWKRKLEYAQMPERILEGSHF